MIQFLAKGNEPVGEMKFSEFVGSEQRTDMIGLSFHNELIKSIYCNFYVTTQEARLIAVFYNRGNIKYHNRKL